MKKFLCLLIVIALMVLVVGCPGQPATPQATPTPGVQAPKEEVKVIKWRMTTGWPSGIPVYEIPQNFAKKVEKMSNGRLVIEVFPGGAIAPAMEASDAVHAGIAEAGHLWSGWDTGKDRTSVLFGGYAGGLNSEQKINWLYGGGGYELWKDWRKEKFNLIAFPLGIRPAEVFLHSHRPVRTLADLRGLKVRTVGAWAEILPKLGASVVSLPAAEVLPALERKVIDATEWGTPGENLPMGFHEVAKYVIIPGVHQPSAPFELVINMRAWEALPDDLKKIVEVAAKATTIQSWAKLGNLDMRAIETFQQKGNVIIEMDDLVRQEAVKSAIEWADKAATDNPWFKKVLESQREFDRKWRLIEANR